LRTDGDVCAAKKNKFIEHKNKEKKGTFHEKYVKRKCKKTNVKRINTTHREKTKED